ncbi:MULTISPECIES: NTP transferase domain-containing protein [Acinetobacter]|uniref:NTP transferase domain-containing protein n=1 Tax=Acinetobacter TaxID=469 RepID=UPI000E357CC5|nr:MULTISPECIES: NTP transferase domain-containing protein [Acinetobacter]RFS26125.1 molybdenum cofactor guanylyltransferase [Acinetobacter sp. SWAC5]RKG39956.1 molybdenum cofactor guanylyltransferase [Acinetobacter cumulans]RZG56431.1 molybdenum cofactor guanylyltransferase [Acinetobacter sp. WCHAc060006]
MPKQDTVDSKYSYTYPKTDLVILAGGQARRMNGVNKLLQTFDQQIQLIKIYQQLKSQVNDIWINSHRDYSTYRLLVPQVQCYQDDETSFQGPLMGIKSAWSHVGADYVLFIPCDVTEIPKQLLKKLHQALAQDSSAKVVYANMNGIALYPLCLIKRCALAQIEESIAQQQRSLKQCFSKMSAQIADFEDETLMLHSINSLDELQQYKQLKSLQI